jgi:sulfatase maturation enzyme AslB (radical SAM superfamily)
VTAIDVPVTAIIVHATAIGAHVMLDAPVMQDALAIVTDAHVTQDAHAMLDVLVMLDALVTATIVHVIVIIVHVTAITPVLVTAITPVLVIAITPVHVIVITPVLVIVITPVLVIVIMLLGGVLAMLSYRRYVLHLTKLCNMDCFYCYEHDKTTSNLNMEQLDLLINEIIDDSISEKIDSVEVEFLGGEPMLNLKGMKYACERITSSIKDAKFMMTTNGTICNKEVIDILNTYKIKIYMSIDGFRSSHNCCRFYKSNKKGTYDDVINNAKIFLERLEEKPGVQFTTHKYNITKLYDGIVSLYNIGFRHINIGVAKQFTNDDFYDIYTEQHRKVLENLDAFEGLLLTPMMLNQSYDKVNYQISITDSNKKSPILEKYMVLDVNTLSKEARDYYACLDRVHKMYIKGA